MFVALWLGWNTLARGGDPVDPRPQLHPADAERCPCRPPTPPPAAARAEPAGRP
ncbi:hypothetical protein QJS66_22220 [Kocuria rhizophila]|nr:hypothetical protein QJS66_22220 [Kocuria rhizophila]